VTEPVPTAGEDCGRLGGSRALEAKDPLTSELDAFLVQQGDYVEETQTWGGGTLPLRVRSYLSDDMPPVALVTTVRAIVFMHANVLVIRDADGTVYVTPGGRREAGETLAGTLRREVLEETGWTLLNVRLIGFMHFRHLADKPEGYHYPYPDFLQLIYTGQAGEYRSEAQEVGIYDAGFQPLEQVRQLSLSVSQRMFLEAGLSRR
jgi:8-oxo-dGTP pyrophosphatase MutT (NUDIX family)